MLSLKSLLKILTEVDLFQEWKNKSTNSPRPRLWRAAAQLLQEDAGLSGHQEVPLDRSGCVCCMSTSCSLHGVIDWTMTSRETAARSWEPVNTVMREDLNSIPGSGRSLGEGNGNPLQYSCLENSMDRGVMGVLQAVSGTFLKMMRWECCQGHGNLGFIRSSVLWVASPRENYHSPNPHF